MNFGFSHNFFHEDVFGELLFWLHIRLLLFSLLSFFSWRLFLLFSDFVFLEHVKGESFFLPQDFIDHELTALSGVQEMNDLLTFRVNMRCVIVIFLNRLLRNDLLSDVAGSGVGKLTEVVGEVLQLVIEVVALYNFILEQIYSLFPLCGHLFAFLFLFLLYFQLLFVHLFEFSNFLVVIVLRNSRLFYLRIVEQPFGEEVNWVLRLGFVHDGKTFGDDKADVIPLNVGCVGVIV